MSCCPSVGIKYFCFDGFDGRLNSLNTSFFYGSSNQALWNIHTVTVVSPSGIDTEWGNQPGIPATPDTINHKV